MLLASGICCWEFGQIKYERLTSPENLTLAWRRITTGTYPYYKRFFRPLYQAYEAGLKTNLKLLSQKLSGAWKPSPSQKLFMPKPSGLLRPIGLLKLEDQIVLQAVANAFARKLKGRRKTVEGRQVFSNILARDADSSIFFLVPWQASYARFRTKVEQYYSTGYRWIAHFDLSAFFDTISHDTLLTIVSPRGGHKDTWDIVREWLKAWASIGRTPSLRHGIPQGPLASNFLAECFLLPLDEVMKKRRIRYVRYVDDIRIFAKDWLEASRAALDLEVQCRNLGLVPHGDKHGIRLAKSVADALGSLPSIALDASDEETHTWLSKEEVETEFAEALGGKPQRILYKSRAKYILYRAPRSQKLLTWVLRLLPRHPEHIDAFAAYLSNYDKSRRIERVICNLLRKNRMPYDYVRGELWQIAARIGTPATLRSLIPLAKQELRGAEACMGLQWGILTFLVTCSEGGLVSFPRQFRRASPLVKALLVPRLSDACLARQPFVRDLLTSRDYDAAIVLAGRLLELQKTHSDYGVKASALPLVAQNVFRALGLIRSRTALRLDPIGDIIANHYGVPYWDKWLTLMGSKYSHALALLRLADHAFLPVRDAWLQYQNSFNDALLRCLLPCLDRLELPGSLKTVNKKGELVSFGVLLDPEKVFARQYPNIAEPLRAANNKRNTLPGSHPYSTKGGSRNRHLTKKEQNGLHLKLSAAYRELPNVLRSL